MFYSPVYGSTKASGVFYQGSSFLSNRQEWRRCVLGIIFARQGNKTPKVGTPGTAKVVAERFVGL